VNICVKLKTCDEWIYYTVKKVDGVINCVKLDICDDVMCESKVKVYCDIKDDDDNVNS